MFPPPTGAFYGLAEYKRNRYSNNLPIPQSDRRSHLTLHPDACICGGAPCTQYRCPPLLSPLFGNCRNDITMLPVPDIPFQLVCSLPCTPWLSIPIQNSSPPHHMTGMTHPSFPLQAAHNHVTLQPIAAHGVSLGSVADKAYPDGCMYRYRESEGQLY